MNKPLQAYQSILVNLQQDYRLYVYILLVFAPDNANFGCDMRFELILMTPQIMV
ncbi:hypothetical protein [Emticicia sp. 17c]|uniref:hypothetical protein n=1 Tax=Emticicia sp. 17c TaxID=3127704 RepID=UPI00301D45CD